MKQTTITSCRKNIMGTTSFNMKMPNMRKEQNFIVYPMQKGDDTNAILIQSDTRIGRLSLETGKGVMSQSHQGGAYSNHLVMDKLDDFEVSTNEMELLKEHIRSTASAKAGLSGIMFCDNSNASKV